MKQEDKELLLKDLCARLPYGVKVQTSYDGIDEPMILERVSPFTNSYSVINGCTILSGISFDIHECKPYLFPLSSMTKEQKEEFYKMVRQPILDSFEEDDLLEYDKENEDRPITIKYVAPDSAVIDWLNAHHFDYRGFIEKGLAIDTTGLNIY